MAGKRGKRVLLFLCILILLLTPGCWGVRETDQLGYIIAMGIDKGKENIIDVTFVVAIPQGKDGGGEKSWEVVSIEAASLFGALQLADAFVSRDMTFMHNRMVIVSEDIAKEGMAKYINPLIRSREIRWNTFLFVTRGSAKEFLNTNKSLLEKYPSRQFEQIMATRAYTGFIPLSDIHEFYQNVKSPGGEPLSAVVAINQGKQGESKDWNNQEKANNELAYTAGTIPREGGNKVEVIGSAVFRGDRLVGYLDGAETRFYQMLQGDYKGAIFTFPDPEKPEEFIIVMEIKKGRPPGIKVDLSRNVPRVSADVILEGEVWSIQSGIDYEKGKKKEELEKYVEEFITGEITKLVQKTQGQFKSDIFGFGNTTRQYFWTWDAWEKYDWLGRYPSVQVKVNVNLAIRRNGLMVKTAEISGSERGSAR